MSALDLAWRTFCQELSSLRKVSETDQDVRDFLESHNELLRRLEEGLQISDLQGSSTGFSWIGSFFNGPSERDLYGVYEYNTQVIKVVLAKNCVDEEYASWLCFRYGEVTVINWNDDECWNQFCRENSEVVAEHTREVRRFEQHGPSLIDVMRFPHMIFDIEFQSL